MEDILPFFPDFAVIDAFKTDICTSLEAYDARLKVGLSCVCVTVL